jgi:hypothetical protein
VAINVIIVARFWNYRMIQIESISATRIVCVTMSLSRYSKQRQNYRGLKMNDLIYPAILLSIFIAALGIKGIVAE